MLKRVDVAVYESMKNGDALETGGFQTLGLAEDGVGYSVDEHNESLLNADQIAQVEAAKAAIIDGSLEVAAYYTNDSCPAHDF